MQDELIRIENANIKETIINFKNKLNQFYAFDNAYINNLANFLKESNIEN